MNSNNRQLNQLAYVTKKKKLSAHTEVQLNQRIKGKNELPRSRADEVFIPAVIKLKMSTKIILLALIISALFTSCHKDDNTVNNPPTSNYKIGKNRFIVKVDGDDREYYVHVPANYTGTSMTPVVFMLHGTSGDGERFYNISGWKEVGETENIITVFPSSWRYCVITHGQQKTTTKWNSQPAEWSFCTGETPRDDIKFLNTIITDLKSKFNIDSQRIYLVGFSNGGQMAAKCSIEMSDKFAAIVESAGSLFSDTTNNIPTYFPIRKMPITYQTGNEDYGPDNTGPTAPLTMLDSLLTTPNIPLLYGKSFKIAQTHINSFALNPNFTITGDVNSIVVATYTSLIPNPLNIFQFVLIKGLAHAYPNGNNHPFKAAKTNWQWMKQFRLP